MTRRTEQTTPDNVIPFPREAARAVGEMRLLAGADGRICLELEHDDLADICAALDLLSTPAAYQAIPADPALHRPARERALQLGQRLFLAIHGRRGVHYHGQATCVDQPAGSRKPGPSPMTVERTAGPSREMVDTRLAS